MILLLSNKWDLSADFVVATLRSLGAEFLRVNTEDLASGRATIRLPRLGIVVSKAETNHCLSEEVNVIWNRRPGKPYDGVCPAERPSAAIQRFVNDQWFSWLEALQLIPGVTWINHPQVNSIMESKPRQLLMASKIGFRVPETLVTNDPDEARSLARRHNDRIVAKALHCPLIEEPEQDFFVFTSEVHATDIGPEEEIRISPLMFQPSLTPKVDYRVTVVGDVVLPVKVQLEDAGEPQQVDWRANKKGLSFRPCDLPNDIEEMCRSYIRTSGLVFGAIDLVEHGGDFFFLEVNPNGEWGWLQHPHGIPVAEALSHLMMSCDM